MPSFATSASGPLEPDLRWCSVGSSSRIYGTAILFTACVATFRAWSRRPSRPDTLAGLRSWHSHTTTTCHPSRRRRSEILRSRRTFALNLLVQNSTLDFGKYARRQFLWRCQKQPWTRTTVAYRGSTMSGRPGSSAACRRNRKPIRHNRDRTAISGSVFCDLIRLMFQLRRCGAMRSISALSHSSFQE